MNIPSSKSKRTVHASIYVLYVCALVIALALPVHAGVFSFIEGLIGGTRAPQATSKNSQNLALLAAARNIDPNPAKGGGDIAIVGGSALISDTGPLGTREDAPAKPEPGQISVYVVREGDSLSQIADMFGVTTDTIIWSNDIGRSGVIRPGQTLVILPVSGVQHTVRDGDTVARIAAKYDADAKDIIAFNQLDHVESLSVGETIIVPDGSIQATPAPVQTVARVRQAQASAPQYSGYYVRPLAQARRTQGIHGYNAVDLAAPIGTPVVAAASGEVIISRTGWNGGYGNYIVIAHPNGTQTLYAHNTRNIVYAGQRVVQGQVIGYVGSTGRSTGPHVHFEVRGAQNPF